MARKNNKLICKLFWHLLGIMLIGIGCATGQAWLKKVGISPTEQGGPVAVKADILVEYQSQPEIASPIQSNTANSQVAVPEKISPKQKPNKKEKIIAEPESIPEYPSETPIHYNPTLPHLSTKKVEHLDEGALPLIPVTPDMLPPSENQGLPSSDKWPILEKGETLIGYEIDHLGNVVSSRILVSAGESFLTDELILTYAGRGLKFKSANTLLQEGETEWILQIYSLELKDD